MHEIIKDYPNTIISMGMESDKLIKISKGLHQRLIKISQDNPYQIFTAGPDGPDIENIISFLVNYYEDMETPYLCSDGKMMKKKDVKTAEFLQRWVKYMRD